MIDERILELAKDGVRLVNCARDHQEEAILKGLESGKVASAGLDVFEIEPARTILYLSTISGGNSPFGC